MPRSTSGWTKPAKRTTPIRRPRARRRSTPWPTEFRYIRPTLLSSRAPRRLPDRIRCSRTEWTGWSGNCMPSGWPGNNKSLPPSHRRPMSAAFRSGAWIATVTAEPCRTPGPSRWSRSGTAVPSASAPHSRDWPPGTSRARGSCPGPSTARTRSPPETSPSAERIPGRTAARRASRPAVLYCMEPGESSLEGDGNDRKEIARCKRRTRCGFHGERLRQHGHVREAGSGKESGDHSAAEAARRAPGAGAGTAVAEDLARAAAGGLAQADRRAGAAEGAIAGRQPAEHVAIRRAGAQPHRGGQEGRAPGAAVQGHAHRRRRRAAVLRFRPREPQGHRQGGAEEGRRGAERIRGQGDPHSRTYRHRADQQGGAEGLSLQLGAVGRARDDRRALPAGNVHPARAHGRLGPRRIPAHRRERDSRGAEEKPPHRDHADRQEPGAGGWPGAEVSRPVEDDQRDRAALTTRPRVFAPLRGRSTPTPSPPLSG